jgi:hypothetical protein
MQNLFFWIEIICPLLFCVANLWLWYAAVTKWNSALRLWVAKRFQVEIEDPGRGSWKVVSPIAWYKKLGIECLQLAYFMILFCGWAIASIAMVVLLGFLQKYGGQ